MALQCGVEVGCSRGTYRLIFRKVCSTNRLPARFRGLAARNRTRYKLLVSSMWVDAWVSFYGKCWETPSSPIRRFAREFNPYR